VKIIKVFVSEFFEWLEYAFAHIPGRVGRQLRLLRYKVSACDIGSNVGIATSVEIRGLNNIRIGNHVSIMSSSRLWAHNNGKMTLGSNVKVNYNSCINAADDGEILIGNNVLIAQNVVIRASDHDISRGEVPILEQGHTGGRIEIQENCWIGANAVIVRNVVIGAHSVVAAGAVVTKDVEPYSLVGGIPARLIRKLHIGKQE